MGANTGGQIGSIMAAAIMLSVVKGLGQGLTCPVSSSSWEAVCRMDHHARWPSGLVADHASRARSSYRQPAQVLDPSESVKADRSAELEYPDRFAPPGLACGDELYRLRRRRVFRSALGIVSSGRGTTSLLLRSANSRLNLSQIGSTGPISHPIQNRFIFSAVT